MLDHIGVLRQADSRVTRKALHLFEPVTPRRGVRSDQSFEYYRGQDAKEVKVELLDASGTTLRTFTGTPSDKEPERGEFDFFFGGGPPPRVGVKKGMNRFTWDLRQEGATVFPGMIMWAARPQRGP